MTGNIVSVIICGALGALIKDILNDNKISLPKKIDDTLILGSLGGIITGAILGYLIDGSLITAFLAGYSGKNVIENLLTGKKTDNEVQTQSIEEIIKYTAQQENVDPDLAVRVAECESKLNPSAIYINQDGSRDRGIFQINDKYHPEVTDEQAFDPVFSTKFFCKAFKEGHLSWWNATKQCWSK